MRVELLGPDHEVKYREFLLRDPRSLIYACIEYRDFLSHAVGGEPTYLIAFDGGGQIAGTLAYFRLEAPGVGTVINSLPWYGSHGGCVASGACANEARRALLDHYRRATEEEDVLSATLVLTPDEEAFVGDYRRILSPCVEDRRIGQLSELPAQSENMELRILQKTRNLVRKSLKQNFVLQVRDDDEAWRFLYETHVENMQAIGGIPKPWAHFVAMRAALPEKFRKLLVAVLAGVPVAALLLLYFNRTVEYVTPVIKHEFRNRQPLSFLIWHGMLDAIRAGYARWNWGGTWITQTSLHHFKAGWGAIDRPYTYLVTSSSTGRSILAANRSRLGELFPFYYTYPYDRL